MTFVGHVHRHRRALFVLLGLLLAAGSWAVFGSARSIYPHVAFPRIAVIVERGEQPVRGMLVEVTRPIEQVVSAVPELDDASRDRTLRFVHLVDTLYDHSVNLLVSAAAPPAGLYRGTRLALPFERTRSRLEEMQSREYLGRSHLP